MLNKYYIEPFTDAELYALERWTNETPKGKYRYRNCLWVNMVYNSIHMSEDNYTFNKLYRKYCRKGYGCDYVIN